MRPLQTRRGLPFAIAIVVGIVSWAALNPDTSANRGRRSLPAIPAPQGEGGTLQAQVWSDGVGRASHTQVEVTGNLDGTELDAVVLRSQESPDMLRVGWESVDHLVISIPQYPQDAGKAVGDGDPEFRCESPKGTPLRVSCVAYAVGPR